MAWMTPITDRTERDALTAMQLQSTTLEDLKGALNPSDLMRIEGNCQYVHDLLLSYGYSADVTIRLDWAMDDLPTYGEITRIRKNVQALLDGFYTVWGALPIEITQYLDYEGANSLEGNLLKLKTLIELMLTSFRYSGSFNFYSGSDFVLP